jgi:hypothetical protein
MLKHELRRTEGILILRPEAPLEATDFQGLAQGKKRVRTISE